jgi:hypothetical protein
MSKQRAINLCGCLAALLLLVGCSGGVGPFQAYSPAAAYGPSPLPQTYLSAAAYATPSPAAPAAIGDERVYAAGPAAPVAILVLLPGPGESVAANPQLWAAQGFDVVAPSPSELFQIMADQQMDAARLIAAAQSMADAPIWLLGPDQAIDAAMASLPRGGAGQVAGVVITSATSGAGTCSERMIYSYSGSGAPKVSVSKSGNACPPGSPFGGGPDISVAPPTPAVPTHAPRLIEASLPARAAWPTAGKAAVQQIADAIKVAPSG